MPNDPPETVCITKKEDGSPSSSDSDLIRETPNDQKPDAKDSRPRRTSAGNRRPRREKEKEKDNMKVEKKDPTDSNPDAKNPKEKEPKPRNRRAATTSMASSNSRKKPKLESPETPPNGVSAAPGGMGVTAPRSPQVTASPPGSTIPSFEHHQLRHSPLPPTAHHPHQQPQQHPTYSGPYSSLPPPSLSYPTAQPYPTSGTPSQPSQPPPQRTSGQNYDPIRSAFDTSSPAPTPSAVSPPIHNPSPRHTFRASASPAINSIIDPQPQASQLFYSPAPHASPSHNLSNVSSPAGPAMAPTPTHHPSSASSMSATSFSHGAAPGPQQPLGSVLQPPSQPPHSYSHQQPYQGLVSQQQQPQEQGPQHEFSKRAQPAHPAPPSQAQQQRPEQPTQAKPQPATPNQPPVTMDVDTDKAAQSNAAKSSGVLKKEKASTTAAASTAPSPQPARPAKEPHTLPQGSGLISDALFGGKGDGTQPSEPPNLTPNIILHVPLQGSGNKIINFARLAEEQYGFAALHPRLAAHQERLARVAAAGAALEKNEKGGKGIEAESADEDLSLDVDRDSDDGDVAMGGTGSGAAASTNGGAATEADGKKRRRRKKVEEYDRDDPFVDDSELVWQEQAAASKDGFFVYSGPLVPEGEKIQVERWVSPFIEYYQAGVLMVTQRRWNDQTRPWSRPR